MRIIFFLKGCGRSDVSGMERETFPLLLYQDGAKKEEQAPFHTLMKEILLFSLTKEMLEEILLPEKELIVELIEECPFDF